MGENLSLFEEATYPSSHTRSKNAPLAEKLRPLEWEQFEGLSALDRRLIAQLRAGKGRAPSLILWGPPGSGKTTLARLIGKSFPCEFVAFSAVLGGVKEVREIVDQAKRASKPTILFVDEIHRFNKGQQDAFLPHVENGTITLIGATTENPSFYLTSALLSRARMLVLPPPSEDSLRKILGAALTQLKLELDDDAARVIVSAAGGDARRLINLTEGFAEARDREGPVSAAEIESFISDTKTLFYDRSGEEHYNMASAFIKSMRGSNPDAALYWGFRMMESGEDPRFIIRRLIIFASEDIGNADPRALQLAIATNDAYEKVGLPEGRIPIAQCITYLASAPKSNRSYAAMHGVIEALREHPRVSVPLHLRNAPTSLMKSLDYGEGYQYPHDHAGGFAAGVQYLPDEIKDRKFYDPSDFGYEKNIKERLEGLKKLRG